MFQNRFYKFFIVLFLILPVFVFAQTEKKKALYFYSESCPHCKEVDQYFEKEKIYEKYEIRKIDVSGEYNLSYLNEFFDSFKISEENRGWPAIFFSNEILVGSPPIIKNFAPEIEKADAYNFPSPESVKKYFLEIKNIPDKNSQSLRSMLAVIVGAGLVDSINPRFFVAIFVLMFILWPSCAKRKFLYAIAGFLLAIFLARLLSGFLIFFQEGFWLKLFRPILALMGIISMTLGIFNLKYPLAIIFHAVYKIKSNVFSVSWLNFFKGLMAGAFSGLFILPVLNETYAPFMKLLSEQLGRNQVVAALSIYNFLFIIPLAILAIIINSAAKIIEVREFCIKNVLLIRIICAVAMVFVGLNIVRASF